MDILFVPSHSAKRLLQSSLSFSLSLRI